LSIGVFGEPFTTPLLVIASSNALFLASDIPKGTSSDTLQASYSVDYVRYYEREVSPIETMTACDVSKAEKRTVVLDLLNREFLFCGFV
jgi:hypothetical protein